ncbi:hypothetical protein [Dictyobacter formicarum]|uniref:Ig-like domain-containing protein n=1 Tax=Dictyobacter formicarum TaxID=2778368 RepID=A0ABQ3VPY1_9CHLR|nr:hypothetical protein [Dictyobacter formicarum]GHO88319.1 hypothetical protein KSZ_63250 [Dictyobacter formicarum]
MSQEKYISSKEGAALLGVTKQSFFYYVESRGIRRREINDGGKDQYEYSYDDLVNIKDEVQAKITSRKKSTSTKAAGATREVGKQKEPSGKTAWAAAEDLPYIYALDCDTYGLEYSVPPTKTIHWWQKNQTAIRVLYNEENRKDIWGCLTLLPMEEEIIFNLLRGDLSEQQITADHILTYEPGKEYNCYVTSCVIRPDKSSSFNSLLNSVLEHWINHPEIKINKLYGFAAGATEDMSDENDGMRLIKKLFFSPRYDIDKNAWELNLNYYNPSPIIQKFQKRLKEARKEN